MSSDGIQVAVSEEEGSMPAPAATTQSTALRSALLSCLLQAAVAAKVSMQHTNMHLLHFLSTTSGRQPDGLTFVQILPT